MAEVTLHLFGPPRLTVDGVPKTLGRRKATALLSFLAVTRSRHHRETLATLLWPESGPEAAYSALRNVLWILRQSGLSDVLRADRSAVELIEDDSLWVDVVRFRELTAGCPQRDHSGLEACPSCVPALEEAVSLAETPFMEGFVVSDADGFDDWQFAEREALQRELTETLDRLTAYYAAVGEWNTVATLARRWLVVDRLNEVCCRRLMSALAALGRRGEALRSYEACRRTLEEELGLTPEAETVELAEQVRRSESAARPPTEPARRTNLPAPLTPFVGREDVLSRAVDLLGGRDARLVSLVGLGGIGKTSLAIQIGRSLLKRVKDGVFLVPLGTVGQVEMVAPSIAEAIGLAHSRDRGAHASLALEDYLQEREILLILDEVERIAGIGAVVTTLLAAAPRLRCLVTSHVPLNVGAETVVALHGLAYPDDDTATAALAEFDAIRLLKVAERRVDSVPATREPELRAMARVARMLEGFPLGLEMAGAWRSVFSWREIADRIAASLDFLVHTHRDVPPRHRNLRAVYEQAWGLLAQEERDTLCRLGVFEGGFTMEAAERATRSSPAVFASLVKRSLVRRVDPERYQVHELLRQFSLENLHQGGGWAEAADRHAAYFVERVETEFEEMKGVDQIAALRRLQRDLANVRAAWLYAAKAGNADWVRRAAHGLFFFFDMRARFEEGARAFLDAIEAYGDREEAVGGFLRVAYGWFVQFTAETEPLPWIREGLGCLSGVAPFAGDHALANVIAAYADAFDDVEARERLGRSLEHYRTVGDRWGEALALDALAGTVFPGDPDEGARLAAESFRLRKEIGDRWGEALNLATQGRFAESLGRWSTAKARYHRSQRLATQIGDDLHMVIDAHIARARIARRLGETAEAESLARDALARARETGNRLLMARSLIELGSLAVGREDADGAQSSLREAFSLLDGTPWRDVAAYCATLLADVAARSGDEAEATRWRQEAEMLDPGGGVEPWMR